MTGAELARAAAALAGVPFRLHGRDPRTGLDCIGLLAAAMDKNRESGLLPNGYALRNNGLDTLMPDPAALGFGPAHDPPEPGDVIVLLAGPGQYHLAIAASGGRFIHAHAGLRRVVVQPGPLSGEPVGHWRLRPDDRAPNTKDKSWPR